MRIRIESGHPCSLGLKRSQLAACHNVLMERQMEELVELWRPTGPEEMELVRATSSRRWPPRLPDQPIFYPVLNEDYATRIARDWNVKASGVGFVTRFRVRKSFLDKYEVQQVGGETILEYWIPAEDLEALNDNIVGTIEEVARFE